MKYDLIGYNTENLLKTLYTKKVNLFNVKRSEPNKLSFEVLDKDAKKVKRFIANFKVKQTLSGIKRLPKFLLGNIGIILGVFVGTIVSTFLSVFTWKIEIYGTEELSIDEIIFVLSQNGINVGEINSQTCEEIEDILLNNYDRIAQVSVIKRGTSIIINLSEKLVYLESEYAPIKARFNGVITSVNVVKGTSNVKIGDYVNIGDVLVLPFNLNSSGDKVAVEPMAEIKGEIFVVGKCEMQKVEQKLVRTGRKQITYNYKLKNLNLFSGKAKNSFALFEFDVYNESVSDLIPFTRDVYTYYEINTISVEHDFDREKECLIEKSVGLAYENLPSGEIVSESTEVSVLENTMFACTTIKLLGIIND